jgi:uncharacterized membrane protein YgcG
MIVRLLVILALALPASARTLQWRAFDVDAHLDRDGNLRVVERHTMLFNGDWNGGMREFRVGARQSIDVNRLARIDGGNEIAMAEGGIDEVDRWERSGDTVRWRSRLPEDPPFANKELTYLIDVTYRNVLQPGDDAKQFTLDHDFGMPAREGAIEKYSLDLTFDPIWRDAQPVHITRENVPPGASEIVRTRLTFGGAADPAGVRRPMQAWIPLAIFAGFALGVLTILARFAKQEHAVGRFAPVLPKFDEGVLELDAELAGAVWDRGVGAPEVAAVLARMTQEGKLASRVRHDTLHLTLKTGRRNLVGYEQALVSKLFFDGRDATNSDSIRAHYASKGFDPAEHIRRGIEEKLTRLVNWDQKVKRFRTPVDVLAIAAAFVFLVAATLLTGEDGVATAIVGGVVSGFMTVFAAIAAYHFSRTIVGMEPGFAGVGVLSFIVAMPFLIACLFARPLDIPPLVVIALAVWTLTLLNLIFDLLKIQDPPELIAYRKRVAGVRQYFLRELRKPQPDMRDEWFPYVLAFGLGKHVERWFRAFGGAAATRTRSTRSSGNWSSSSSSSGASSWTGGGGAFGGAGASGTWAVAATGLAAGVAAPSSSGSSGGGGGGGSSSGGGGGGGW